MTTTDTEYVNWQGEELNIAALQAKSPKKPATRNAPEKYHKGHRVEGVPPQAWSDRVELHKRLVQLAKECGGQMPDPLPTEIEWLGTAKLKRIRPAPYQLHEAATECMQLAEKAGWRRVRITAIKSKD